MLYSEAAPRAEEYAKRRRLSIKKLIGGGTQGVVYSTETGTAIKALIRQENYITERNAYIRLKERGVGKVLGFNVPGLIGYHNGLLVIEMEIVTPPFVLDFASAYIDSKPPYLQDETIMEEWEASKREEFEDNWPTVRRILREFRTYGIYLADVRPTNVEF